jgi:hypothetical protein
LTLKRLGINVVPSVPSDVLPVLLCKEGLHKHICPDIDVLEKRAPWSSTTSAIRGNVRKITIAISDMMKPD